MSTAKVHPIQASVSALRDITQASEGNVNGTGKVSAICSKYSKCPMNNRGNTPPKVTLHCRQKSFSHRGAAYSQAFTSSSGVL